MNWFRPTISFGLLPALPLCGALLCCAGCAGDKEQPQAAQAQRTLPQDWPKIRTLKPKVAPRPVVDQLIVDRIALPLDGDLGESWSYISQAGMSAQAVALWQANGMRIGVTNLAGYSRFLDKLPRPTNRNQVGHFREQIAMTDEAQPIEIGPFVRSAVEIQWRDKVGDEEHTMRLPAGKPQMLLRIQRTADGPVLALTPHHHWVAPSLSPPTADQLRLAGRVFDSLTLRALVPPQAVLIVAYAPPGAPSVPAAADAAPAQQVRPEATDDDAPEGDTNGEPAPRFAPPGQDGARQDQPRPTLGSLLLTGEHKGHPVQIVTVIFNPDQLRLVPQGDAPPRPVTQDGARQEDQSGDADRAGDESDNQAESAPPPP